MCSCKHFSARERTCKGATIALDKKSSFYNNCITDAKSRAVGGGDVGGFSHGATGMMGMMLTTAESLATPGKPKPILQQVLTSRSWAKMTPGYDMKWDEDAATFVFGMLLSSNRLFAVEPNTVTHGRIKTKRTRSIHLYDMYMLSHLPDTACFNNQARILDPFIRTQRKTIILWFGSNFGVIFK